jgi:hypothetical protein
MRKSLQVLEARGDKPAVSELGLPWQRRLGRGLKLVLFVLVLYFVGRALTRQLSSLAWWDVNFQPFWMGVAFLSLLAARLMILVTFHPLLRPFCGSLGFRELAPLAWIPPLGRYVPGKVLTVAWSISMLRERGASTSASVVVPFLMVSLAVLVGLMVAAPLTLWQPIQERLPSAWGWSIVLLGGGVICLHPRVLRVVGNVVLRRLGRGNSIVLPSFGQYLATVAAMLGQVFLAGITLWLVARSLTNISVAWIPLCISGMGLAGSMGLLAVFAPAGIGVREGILLLILVPIVGNGLAAVLVLAIRCLQTIADILLAGVGWVVSQSSARLGVREGVVDGGC